MAQPPHQITPTASFSRGQSSPSPVTLPQQPYSNIPAAKRVCISPSPASQPTSPYTATSPFNTHSPMGAPSPTQTPTTAATAINSPSLAHASPQYKASPYLNGTTNGAATSITSAPVPTLPTPTPPVNMSMPESPHVTTPTSSTYTATVFAPAATAMPTMPTPSFPNMPQPAVSTPGALPPPGAMGPPSKVPDKPAREDHDPNDILAGTGVDLSAEERLLSEYAGAYDFDVAAKTGFPQLPSGGKSSFYGAGPANQSEQLPMKEYEDKVKKWDESASKVQAARATELNKPFSSINLLHAHMKKIAAETGVELNLVPKDRDKDGKEKPSSQGQGGRGLDVVPTLSVAKKVGEDGKNVDLYSSYIPKDSNLVDQLALLSIGIKARVRSVLEESYRVSKHRQETTHGAPAGWADAATPLPGIDGSGAHGGAEEAGENGIQSSGAASKTTIPAKRTATEAKLPNEIVASLRDIARQERAAEEKRLLRRQKRQKGNSAGPSRSGSVAPGTPGSVAPEPEKPLTKKEQKKQQKLAEQATTANVNSTTSHFLFSKKDKKKKYSWMTSASASTPSTPRASGAPGAPGPSAPAAPTALTTDGRYRLGVFREDGLNGKVIQMRDLIVTLEKSYPEQPQFPTFEPLTRRDPEDEPQPPWPVTSPLVRSVAPPNPLPSKTSVWRPHTRPATPVISTAPQSQLHNQVRSEVRGQAQSQVADERQPPVSGPSPFLSSRQEEHVAPSPDSSAPQQLATTGGNHPSRKRGRAKSKSSQPSGKKKKTVANAGAQSSPSSGPLLFSSPPNIDLHNTLPAISGIHGTCIYDGGNATIQSTVAPRTNPDKLLATAAAVQRIQSNINMHAVEGASISRPNTSSHSLFRGHLSPSPSHAHQGVGGMGGFPAANSPVVGSQSLRRSMTPAAIAAHTAFNFASPQARQAELSATARTGFSPLINEQQNVPARHQGLPANSLELNNTMSTDPAASITFSPQPANSYQQGYSYDLNTASMAAAMAEGIPDGANLLGWRFGQDSFQSQ
ncbi:hypothetical protein MKZ38_004361 [Zalerion maritima]|uniref:Transcription initiation factor TFIID subunit 4 n=1 Tax=Zalerion maritima TaxID=339359 RepID=A0AAD5WR30_9PEZI|nr:hypothetical protein MKZ38_004361 [Zalerion maritima]